MPSLCRSSSPAAGSRQSIAMLFGNIWLSCAAMQHFVTATVFFCPQIRRSREMQAALYAEGAPCPGCLRFHIIHSKRMSSE